MQPVPGWDEVFGPVPRVALRGYAAALTLGYVMGRLQRPTGKVREHGVAWLVYNKRALPQAGMKDLGTASAIQRSYVSELSQIF